jgi:hypothetical protein
MLDFRTSCVQKKIHFYKIKKKLLLDRYINMGHIMQMFSIQKTALYWGSGRIGVKNWTFIQTEAGLFRGGIEKQNFLNTD